MVATARYTTVRTTGVATLGLLGALVLPFVLQTIMVGVLLGHGRRATPTMP